MIEWIITTLKANTHLVIFITLAAGYWLGGFKIGKFALGSVTGTLLAGVLIGQLGFDISGQVKSMFFAMFLFAVGYSVGPQFVQGVARDGMPCRNDLTWPGGSVLSIRPLSGTLDARVSACDSPWLP